MVKGIETTGGRELVSKDREIRGKRPSRGDKISRSNLEITADNCGYAKKLGDKGDVEE